MEYSQKVIENYTNPQNVGQISDADGVGQVGNPVCGDIMKIFLRVEGEVITDVKFKTFGCGAAVASSSITTQLIKGKSLEEALALTNADVVRALGGTAAGKAALLGVGGGGYPRGHCGLLSPAGEVIGGGNPKTLCTSCRWCKSGAGGAIGGQKPHHQGV